jgi:hypothetical protein
MGMTVTNVHGATGTFYFGKQGNEEVSGVLKGAESIYLDEVYRSGIATDEATMQAASDSLGAAGNVGAVSDGQ